MTLDQYNTAVKQIFAEQQKIAEQTGKLALASMANPTNPDFTALMTQQWGLMQAMAKLNADMMMGIGKA